MSHWFQGVIGFGERTLPAPVAEPIRYAAQGRAPGKSERGP